MCSHVQYHVQVRCPVAKDAAVGAGMDGRECGHACGCGYVGADADGLKVR